MFMPPGPVTLIMTSIKMAPNHPKRISFPGSRFVLHEPANRIGISWELRGKTEFWAPFRPTESESSFLQASHWSVCGWKSENCCSNYVFPSTLTKTKIIIPPPPQLFPTTTRKHTPPFQWAVNPLWLYYPLRQKVKIFGIILYLCFSLTCPQLPAHQFPSLVHLTTKICPFSPALSARLMYWVSFSHRQLGSQPNWTPSLSPFL